MKKKINNVENKLKINLLQGLKNNLYYYLETILYFLNKLN